MDGGHVSKERIHNMTSIDIDVISINVPYGYGWLECTLGETTVVKPNQTREFDHGGIFLVRHQSKIFRFDVDEINWDALLDQQYLGWDNRNYLFGADEKLYVSQNRMELEDKEKKEIPRSQPPSYPLEPKTMDRLEPFRRYMSRVDL